MPFRCGKEQGREEGFSSAETAHFSGGLNCRSGGTTSTQLFESTMTETPIICNVSENNIERSTDSSNSRYNNKGDDHKVMVDSIDRPSSAHDRSSRLVSQQCTERGSTGRGKSLNNTIRGSDPPNK